MFAYQVIQVSLLKLKQFLWTALSPIIISS